MKKWLIAVLAVLLVLGLAACGGNQQSGTNGANGGNNASGAILPLIQREETTWHRIRRGEKCLVFQFPR